MQLDVGRFFFDRLSPDGKPLLETLARNSWVMQGYSRLQHDVANLSMRDLVYAQKLFERESFRMRAQDLPLMGGLVSANVRAKNGETLNPLPFVIKELAGSRLPLRADSRQTFRIGIVGLTEHDPTVAAQVSGFTIDDPLISARRSILRARPQCDLLVVLAYLPEDQAFKLLDLNPEIDVVIAPRGRWGRRYRGHHGMIVYADRQTKALGELRIYVDEAGNVKNITERTTLLDERIPDDPGVARLVKAAREEITTAQKAQLGPKFLPPATTPLAAGLFVTSETCGACHSQEFAQWKASGHARAFATLEKRNDHLDPACVRCHTTGYQEGGFKQALLTPQLAGVQCESCHGPGQAHIADPLKPYKLVAGAEGCLNCHSSAHSPNFDFAAYWRKIQH